MKIERNNIVKVEFRTGIKPFHVSIRAIQPIYRNDAKTWVLVAMSVVALIAFAAVFTL